MWELILSLRSFAILHMQEQVLNQAGEQIINFCLDKTNFMGAFLPNTQIRFILSRSQIAPSVVATQSRSFLANFCLLTELDSSLNVQELIFCMVFSHFCKVLCIDDVRGAYCHTFFVQVKNSPFVSCVVRQIFVRRDFLVRTYCTISMQKSCTYLPKVGVFLPPKQSQLLSC